MVLIYESALYGPCLCVDLGIMLSCACLILAILITFIAIYLRPYIEVKTHVVFALSSNINVHNAGYICTPNRT